MSTQFFLKWAQTSDGFIDHDGKDRLIISSPEDKLKVRDIRKTFDMILVGGNTVRRDNPILKSFTEKNKPAIRAVLSSSGNLPANAKIFNSDDGAKRVIFTNKKTVNTDSLESLGVDIILVSKQHPASEIKSWCESHDVARVLVEGGASVHAQFISENVYDYIRVATGKINIGKHGTVKAFDIEKILGKLRLEEEERLGDTKVKVYSKT